MKISATKQRIIETATDLFYKNGYNLTGINEIIAEAGIAKATLYSHFRSKEDICIAYLGFKNDTFLKELKAFCEAKKKGNEQLIGLFDFLFSFFKGDNFNGCWCLRTVAEIPRENKNIRLEIQKHKRVFLAFIQDLVKENKPELSSSLVVTLSKNLYLLYESAVAESHLYGDSWPIKSARQLAKELI